MVNDLIFIFATLLLSAFFSGMEIAFISSNRLQVELERKQGKLASKIISAFQKRPGHYIATMLVGNNVALVIYGIIMGKLLDPFIGQFVQSEISILIFQTIISTLIILFTAEFLPKTIFRANANAALNLFAVFVKFFYIIFFPISNFTIWLSNKLIKKIFKQEIKDEQNVRFGKIDLNHYLRQMEEKMNNKNANEVEHEIKFLKNALDFSKITIRECKVPRPEIEAIELNTPVEELKKKFIETGYSRILVYENSIDKIIGYCHSYDLFKNPQTVKDCLNQISIVPETMSANKLLALLIQEQKSLAVVVDEYGGTAGIVSIEDVIEEIFGEIEDEHDISEFTERKIAHNEYLLSGRLEIDYLNEKYHLNIPTGDYETIAGFIIMNHNNIPIINEVIEINEFQFKIMKVTQTRVQLVNLKIKKN